MHPPPELKRDPWTSPHQHGAVLPCVLCRMPDAHLSIQSWYIQSLLTDGSRSRLDLSLGMPASRSVFATLQPTSAGESNAKKQYSKLELHIYIHRRYMFVLWSLLLPCFLLSGSALTQWGMAPTSSGDRLAVVFTLLLAIISLKMTVASMLPQLPYLTLVDSYIVASSVYVTMIAVETAILGSFTEREGDDKGAGDDMGDAVAGVVGRRTGPQWLDADLWHLDRTLGVVAAVIFVAYNLVFVFIAMRARCSQQDIRQLSEVEDVQDADVEQKRDDSLPLSLMQHFAQKKNDRSKKSGGRDMV